MNKVTLVGRLAKDPELRTTNTGKSVCSFTVAVNRRFQQEGQPSADFFNVTAWGKQGEVINQYMAKGRQIALSGRLQNRTYDAKDGTKRYVVDVILEEFDFIGSNGDSGTNREDSGGMGNGQAPASGYQQDMLLGDDDFHMIADDDDVPF